MNGLTIIQMVLQVIGLMAIGSVILNAVDIPDVSVTIKDQNIIRWTCVRIHHRLIAFTRRFKRDKKLAEVVDLASYRTRRNLSQQKSDSTKSA